MMVRTFISGMFEMLRRLQWNFCKSLSLLIFDIAWHTGSSNEYTDRLETEHIGNMDQYRVNREIPLPYASDFEILELEEDRDIPTGKC
jgi:hypothetical protein